MKLLPDNWGEKVLRILRNLGRVEGHKSVLEAEQVYMSEEEEK